MGGSSGSGGSTGGSGGTSTTTTSAGGSGGSGTGGSGGSSGGTAGSGGAAGAGGKGGSGGSGGSSGGTAGTAGAAGTGGSGGSGDGGVACNTNPGKALQFNGQKVDIMSGDLGMDLPGGDVPRTIEMWAKYLGAPSWVAEGSLLETGLAMGGMNRVLGFDNSGYTAATMTAEFGPYTNGYSDNNHPPPGGVFVMNIPQTGWVHLSWSYSGNHGTLSFTVNGMEYPVKTQAGPPTLNFYPGIVTLGASQTFGTNGWTGVMDEVRIWSVAKTPTEINRDMRVVLKGTEPGLVAYYRFEEGMGTFTDDVSKKASHRLTVCTTMNTTTCNAANNAMPTWVASDIPGTFTCAP
jgi:hypothetical protein